MAIELNIDWIAIGERIRKARKAKKLTQEKLAEMVDLSTSFMGHVERGSRVESIHTALALCKIFDMNIEYLLLGEHSYQASILPEEIIHALERMSEKQRSTFLKVMMLLAEHPEMWEIR